MAVLPVGCTYPISLQIDQIPHAAEFVHPTRKRVYNPAVKAAGISGSRPYDLRHSFASLLIHEGATVPELARQLGNACGCRLSDSGLRSDFRGDGFCKLGGWARRPRQLWVAVAGVPAGSR
jgi:hypothetical protein